jgi:hypothetical protein
MVRSDLSTKFLFENYLSPISIIDRIRLRSHESIHLFNSNVECGRLCASTMPAGSRGGRDSETSVAHNVINFLTAHSDTFSNSTPASIKSKIKEVNHDLSGCLMSSQSRSFKSHYASTSTSCFDLIPLYTIAQQPPTNQALFLDSLFPKPNMQLSVKSTLLSPILLITLIDGANSDCTSSFSLCAPPGATSNTTPQLSNPDFQNLFVDIISSSLPSNKRSLSTAGTASLCCYTTLSCLLLSSLSLPFCYDRFTTNYYLPDGSYGTVYNGSYVSPAGTTANLITGDYELYNGSTGNIYTGDEGEKPNAATLSMPTPYTSSGIGSAIPASGLGGLVTVTYTTTFPGMTIPPSTIEPTTLPAVVLSETVILPTTITAQVGSSVTLITSVVETASMVTEMRTVIAGTMVQGTTVNPVVETLTTTEVGGVGTTSGSASTTGSVKKSEAVRGNGIWFVLGLSCGLVVGILLRDYY